MRRRPTVSDGARRTPDGARPHAAPEQTAVGGPEAGGGRHHNIRLLPTPDSLYYYHSVTQLSILLPLCHPTTILSPNSLYYYHSVTQLSTLLSLCHPSLYTATSLSPNVLHCYQSVTQCPTLLPFCHPTL